MAFTKQQIQDITLMLDNYVENNRPPEDIRSQLDLGWRIGKQSVYLFEIRPQWNDQEILLHHDFAKASWVQSRRHWEIFWMRGNLKWYRYDPLPEVGNLQRFLIEVEKDPLCCFRG